MTASHDERTRNGAPRMMRRFCFFEEKHDEKIRLRVNGDRVAFSFSCACGSAPHVPVLRYVPAAAGARAPATGWCPSRQARETDPSIRSSWTRVPAGVALPYVRRMPCTHVSWRDVAMSVGGIEGATLYSTPPFKNTSERGVSF
jgi:hypothetical protein